MVTWCNRNMRCAVVTRQTVGEPARRSGPCHGLNGPGNHAHGVRRSETVCAWRNCPRFTTHAQHWRSQMPDIPAILAKPEDFGFTFLTETVKRDKVPSQPVPLIKVTDLTRFDAAFPGVILETEDGQSIRVNSQRVVRDAWFIAADGKAYATQEEATQASVEWALAQ